jgi:hypothetical protein
MIIFNQGSFSFIDGDGDGLLLILVSGESLTFFGWDERSFWNNFGHNSSDSFDSQSKWGGIDNNDIFSGI